jgi:hypothetical protein
MSASACDFTGGSGSWDFTTGQNKAYGTQPMAALGAGGVAPFGLFAGNAEADDVIDLDDLDWYITATVNGMEGYRFADFNLNGFVEALDFNLYISNTLAGASSQVP